MTGAGSGGGGGYDYVEAFYPSDAEEGESLYHLTENAAFVYSGTEWIEQTVTDHSQLSGVNDGDHRSDQRVSDLAPVQVRYSDDEARQAVDGSNVAVEDANTANVADVASNAENADKLGGKQPSHFEPPAQTGNTGKIETGFVDPNLSHTISSGSTTDTTFSFDDDTVVDYVDVRIKVDVGFYDYQDGADEYDVGFYIDGFEFWNQTDSIVKESDGFPKWLNSGITPIPTVRLSDIEFQVYIVKGGGGYPTAAEIEIEQIHKLSAPSHSHPL